MAIDQLDQKIGALQDKMRQQLRRQVGAAISSVSILLIAGTLVFHAIENWTWAQSFYFSVATMATVGYGDLTPSTDFSRVVTAIYILVGASVAVASLGIIGSSYIRSRTFALQEREEQAKKLS
jgi:voltage-gated potassium channel Kch